MTGPVRGSGWRRPSPSELGGDPPESAHESSHATREASHPARVYPRSGGADSDRDSKPQWHLHFGVVHESHPIQRCLVVQSRADVEGFERFDVGIGLNRKTSGAEIRGMDKLMLVGVVEPFDDGQHHRFPSRAEHWQSPAVVRLRLLDQCEVFRSNQASHDLGFALGPRTGRVPELVSVVAQRKIERLAGGGFVDPDELDGEVVERGPELAEDLSGDHPEAQWGLLIDAKESEVRVGLWISFMLDVVRTRFEKGSDLRLQFIDVLDSPVELGMDAR